MAFGQQSGPPATGKQLQQLLALLEAAGHSDFRDARGPMGFTQRQAGGKFTRDEADAYIEQLEAEAEAAEGGDEAAGAAPAPAPSAARPKASAPKASAPKASAPRAGAPKTGAPKPGTGPERLTTAQQTLRRMPDDLLAAELQRRGWVVMEP
jgi:hypothetical protein